MNPSNIEMKGNSETMIDDQTVAEKKEQFNHADKCGESKEVEEDEDESEE